MFETYRDVPVTPEELSGFTYGDQLLYKVGTGRPQQAVVEVYGDRIHAGQLWIHVVKILDPGEPTFFILGDYMWARASDLYRPVSGGLKVCTEDYVHLLTPGLPVVFESGVGKRYLRAMAVVKDYQDGICTIMLAAIEEKGPGRQEVYGQEVSAQLSELWIRVTE